MRTLASACSIGPERLIDPMPALPYMSLMPRVYCPLISPTGFVGLIP